MRIREFQLDKIEEARRIQQDCLRLHLPCPPVLHWAYDIKAPDGEIVEQGRGKANSFTRNALNIMTSNLGMCAAGVVQSGSFSDGYVNTKNTSGALSYTNIYRYSASNIANASKIYIGSDTSEESLDSYSLPIIPITDGGTSVASTWDSTNRKMITQLIGIFLNSTGSAANITESGIRMSLASTVYALMVRDVFSPITVANGETITWTYTTEVAYPNP